MECAASSQAINPYTVLSTLKRRFSMGMSDAKENTLRTADSKLNISEPTMYLL